jgi:membrane protein YdbS with pleckstrin-like domain
MKPYWMLWTIFWIVVGVLSWSVPTTFSIPKANLMLYLLCVYVPLIVALVYVFWWIGKFYNTIEYELRENAVHAKYGVFFRKEKEISYGRITMAGLSQGPLKRHFGIYNIPVFTAARGGTNLPEMCLMNVKNGPEIRDQVSTKIGKLSEKERKSIEEKMLEELKEIRKTLQK